MERWNIGETWGTASYLILSEKLIEPELSGAPTTTGYVRWRRN